MSIIKLIWTPAAKVGFDELQNKAREAGKVHEFVRAHNEVVLALRDPQSAFERGELLFTTQTPSGEVRLFLYQMISVCYVVYRHEPTGLILKYKSVPDEWPEY